MTFKLLEGGEGAEALPSNSDETGISLIALGLRTLSQRALTAVADLFTLLTVASAWWLWLSIPHPDTYQLVSLSIYALLVLAANWIVRRR